MQDTGGANQTQVEMLARLTITKEGSRSGKNRVMETDGETHRAGEEDYAKNDSELRTTVTITEVLNSNRAYF